MSDNNQNGESLYQLAYDAHYKHKKFDLAYALYNKVIEIFPGSYQAVNAAVQINNITSNYPDTVPNIDEANLTIEAGEIVSKNVEKAGEQDYCINDYSEATVDSGGNGWITGMKIVSFITFIGIIIYGITIAIQTGGGLGTFVFIASFIIAFLSVGLLMVFLNLAQDVSKMTQDISEIKQIFLKKQ